MGSQYLDSVATLAAFVSSIYPALVGVVGAVIGAVLAVVLFSASFGFLLHWLNRSGSGAG